MLTPDLASHTAALLDCEDTLYKRVALRISELVEHGTLRPGDQVPSIRRCSQQQNVSIATVTQAYRLLEDRGVIESRPQSGYYVRAQRWARADRRHRGQVVLESVGVEEQRRRGQVVDAHGLSLAPSWFRAC